jgi:PAS domain S-box-containing protein
MIERVVHSLKGYPAFRQIIEWFAVAYIVLMPVALALLDGVRCVSAGCRGGTVVDAAVKGFQGAFDPSYLTWHLAHAAMIAVTAAVFGYLLDKSHRREKALLQVSFEKYHEAIDNLESGFYRTTLDGRFLLANTRFVSMLGYESLDELMQAPVSALYPTKSSRDRFLATLREKGHVHQLEFLLVKKDGTPLLVSDDAHLVGNTITGIISVVERTLGRNIITICAYCNMMRDGNTDDAPWVRPQTYFVNHLKEIKDPLQDFDFSHGICPTCVQREFLGFMPALTQSR